MRIDFPQKTHFEVHLFNFHQNIYGQNLLVEFIQKIRDEKKFPSPSALIHQLKKDDLKAQHILSRL